MTIANVSVESERIAEQRALWRRQASSIPSLLGGKAVWVRVVLDLVEQVGDGRAVDLDVSPKFSFDLDSLGRRSAGASPRREPASWRQYYSFLRGLQLVEKGPEGIRLTTSGALLRSDAQPKRLAEIFADRVRAFAETLSLISEEPSTVEAVDQKVRASYHTSGRNVAFTRSRMDWQEALGLIEPVGGRRWQISPEGQALLEGRLLVSPQAFDVSAEREPVVPSPPPEVAALLDELSLGTRTHDSRSTYNIWVPSPPSSPNKVENLRTIVNAALERLDREELFAFICENFNLQRTSVESMLPFLRAAGLLVEVGRGVFEATPAARAWVESEDDLNFVRILHANMRFVGEMIASVEGDSTRQDMYAAAAEYGLNIDKSRWIASFLLDTSLIEESRYGSLRSTPLGLALRATLPLAPVAASGGRDQAGGDEYNDEPKARFEAQVGVDLVRLAREPLADGKPSGKAFEDAIRMTFLLMGFEARGVGGSGDTDVLVNWVDADGSRMTAVVEAKVRSSGQVTHTDVSDVALETHKLRHHANFVAIVGPSFAGDTIENMAAAKGWVLLDAARLQSVASSVVALGLRPHETAKIFSAGGGIAEVDDVIAQRERQLKIVSYLIKKLTDERSESGEALSARDISRDGRKSNLSPTVDEVMSAIKRASEVQIDALRLVEHSDDLKYSTYSLGDVTAAARQLRALADALEQVESRTGAHFA